MKLSCCHANSRLSTLMQLLFSFDQDMRVDETLQTFRPPLKIPHYILCIIALFGKVNDLCDLRNVFTVKHR